MLEIRNIRKLHFITVFLFLMLCITGCSSAKVSGSSQKLVMDPEIVQGVLDNGMTYYVRQNPTPRNRIVLRLAVKAGSCYEEEDQKGVAHFIEHLCFNGTENFEKSAIVDYFESIGMNFGPEVNAHTSFEETVYKLEIPADDPAILRKSLLVLHDWACAVTFDQAEIDKERGVVIEEWRGGQGFQGRVSDRQINFLFKNSKYSERQPIGDPEIIRTISRDRIIDFYKKWYRPEFMSVIAAGDIDKNVLEEAIKEVMGTIPASKNKIKLPSFSVPAYKGYEVDIMKDKEQDYTIAYIFSRRKDYAPMTTVRQLREDIVLRLATNIFNQRLSEKAMLSDCSWLQAVIMENRIIRKENPIEIMAFVPKTGLFTEALKEFLDEYERFLNQGVTESELSRVKQGYLQGVLQSYQNRENHPSVNYAESLTENFYTGRVYLSDEDDLAIESEIVRAITTDEVINTARKHFADRGSKFFICGPDNADDIPSEEALIDIWRNYESEAANEAYVDDVENDQLMERPENKGKVISKKGLLELDGTEYVFENGIRVITKQTNFEKNSISIYAGSKGGLFKLKEEDIPSAKVCTDYLFYSGIGDMSYSQLVKKISNKRISMNINLRNTEESFSGWANSESIETSLQMINLFFTQPRFTEEGWNVVKSNVDQAAENFGVKPEDVFKEKINELVYGKTLFHASFDKNFVSKMNPKTAERIFKERFANPADFTFVFVGDFDEKNLIDLCASYLGTLPTSNKREETQYVYFDFPKNSKTATVKKGIDDQGEVVMVFGGELPPAKNIEQSFEESNIMHNLVSLLDIRLREVIREDKSGSYGVGVDGYIDGYPNRYYKIVIVFGCEPAREEELVEAVLEELKAIQNGKISQENIGKIKESYTRGIEGSLRDNGWWLSRFAAEEIFNYEPLWFTTESNRVAEKITANNIQNAAKKYINLNDYITVYLKPE